MTGVRPAPWPEPIRLTGRGVVLREWTDADLPRLRTLLDDAEVRRYTPLPAPFDDVAAVNHLRVARDRRRAGESIQLAITVDGVTPMGEILVFRTDLEPGVGELAYAVGARHRGRGLATAGLRLLSEYARTLGLTGLCLKIGSDNPASETVAARAGFVRTDIVDSVELSDGSAPPHVVWVFTG